MNARIVVFALVLCALGVSARVAEQARPDVAMARAADAFLAALDTAQRAKVAYPFDSEERFNWHFIPRVRKGLPLAEMTPAQRDSAFALLKTGLSASGFSRVEAIRSLETVLRAMENRNSRDPEQYFFTIFGRPDDATWGWRYEGHHLAQNWTVVAGRAIATTPAFLGANPAVVMDGPMKGTRALAAEADLAWALLDGLQGPSRAAAIVAGAAPADIVTGNSRKAAILENVGLSAREMSAKEQGLLMSLIEAHASVQQPALAAARLSAIKAGGFEHVRFTWIGATKNAPGAAHYYRIQGPTFLIEYDNTQNNANHQHIVWRDFAGDFGEDLLAKHYAADPHARAR
jgi:Protein of unknown function (DUF3500)